MKYILFHVEHYFSCLWILKNQIQKLTLTSGFYEIQLICSTWNKSKVRFWFKCSTWNILLKTSEATSYFVPRGTCSLSFYLMKMFHVEQSYF